MKELTKEQFEQEFLVINKNNYSLEEYIKASRFGSSFALDRKTKKYIYESNEYNKNIKPMYDSRCNDLFNQNKNHGLSRNGMIAYNAICQYRDEVMLIDA